MTSDETLVLEEARVTNLNMPVSGAGYSNGQLVHDDIAALEDKFFSRGFSYEFTKDPELLLQYFNIRRQAYANNIGFEDFAGSYDDADARSEIVVAMDSQGEVIGGTRLTASDPLLEYYLPLEEDGFELKDIFPEYDLESCRYGECSRMALKEEYRDGEYYVLLCDAIYRRSRELNLKYLFCHATSLHARKYRQMWTHYFHLKTHTKLTVDVPYNPKYRSDLKFCISSLEMDI